MKTKLPPLKEVVDFLEQAEELADGKRQSKYIAGVVEEFAHYVNSADLLAEHCISISELRKFLVTQRDAAAADAALYVSEHKEGCYEAFEQVLNFINGETTKE